MIEMITFLNEAIFIYFICLSMGYTILLLASFPDIIQYFDEIKFGNIPKFMNRRFLTPITIIMPAYNLSTQVVDAVESILKSNYNNVHIIIVNDGSTDDTLETLIQHFDLSLIAMAIDERLNTAKLKGHYVSKTIPNLTVIDKVHSNTGDSLNVGLNACRTPIFATVDADTLLSDDAVARIMFTFFARKNCIAVGGAIYILNDNPVKAGEIIVQPRIPTKLVPALQLCEYFRSFLFGRSGWNSFGGALSFAGAFTLFETEAALSVGGYDTENFAQDCEIVLKMHGHMRKNKFPYRIVFNPSAFAWTKVPTTFAGFWTQRDHWQRGLLRSFCLHRNMFLNPTYGIVGMFSYPFYVFFELLAPVIECTAYILIGIGWYLGIIQVDMLILFFALAIGYIGFLTVATLFINLVTFNHYARWYDTLRIFFLSIIDMLFFRQYHVLCKVVATFRYVIHRIAGERL